MLFPETSQIIFKEGDGEGIDFYFDGAYHEVGADGDLKRLSQVESLKEWIRKVVCTIRGAFPVYTENEKKEFGVTIYEHLGEKNADYWRAEHEREVKTQLITHPLIERVEDVSVRRERGGVYVSFKVITTKGTLISDTIKV